MDFAEAGSCREVFRVVEVASGVVVGWAVARVAGRAWGVEVRDLVASSGCTGQLGRGDRGEESSVIGSGDNGANFKARGVAGKSSKEVGKAVLREQPSVRTYVGYKHLVEGADKYKDALHSFGLHASNGIGAVSLVSAKAELAQRAGVRGDVQGFGSNVSRIKESVLKAEHFGKEACVAIVGSSAPGEDASDAMAVMVHD